MYSEVIDSLATSSGVYIPNFHCELFSAPRCFVYEEDCPALDTRMILAMDEQWLLFSKLFGIFLLSFLVQNTGNLLS